MTKNNLLPFLLTALCFMGCGESETNTADTADSTPSNDLSFNADIPLDEGSHDAGSHDQDDTEDASVDADTGDMAVSDAVHEVMPGDMSAEDTHSDGSTEEEPEPLDIPSLAINELSGLSPDWFEFVNYGDEEQRMAGIYLTDSNDDGTPHEGHMTRFPGTMILEPGEHFVVYCGPDLPLEGVLDEEYCGLEGVEKCIHVDFRLSNGNGETVYLIMPNGEDIIDSAVYPPEAVEAGQTWCRIPDVDGEFVPCEPTPATTNVEAAPSVED